MPLTRTWVNQDEIFDVDRLPRRSEVRSWRSRPSLGSVGAAVGSQWASRIDLADEVGGVRRCPRGRLGPSPVMLWVRTSCQV
jgi:hypothetical protein